MSVSLIKGTAIPRPHFLRTSGVAARVGIVGMFWAAIIVGFSTPVLSLAADATHVVQMKIRPQPLGAALQELASQSGMQIIFFSKLAEGYYSPAVNGKFTPEAALGILLDGTGLTFHRINNNTIEVRTRAAFHKTSNAAEAGSAAEESTAEAGTSAASGPPRWALRLAQADPAGRPAAERPTTVPESEYGGTIQEVIVT